MYSVATLDWRSRGVRAHQVSIKMKADCCVQASREGVARSGAPAIDNTNHGSQFSSADFVVDLKSIGTRERLDGPGSWRDDAFVGRLWRSVKYENMHLQTCGGATAARQ